MNDRSSHTTQKRTREQKCKKEKQQFIDRKQRLLLFEREIAMQRIEKT